MVYISFWFMVIMLIYFEEAYTIKENAEFFVMVSKKSGLEVNVDKTKYMVMSRDQNIRRSHSVKTDNSSFEKVEELKYLGTTLTD